MKYHKKIADFWEQGRDEWYAAFEKLNNYHPQTEKEWEEYLNQAKNYAKKRQDFQESDEDEEKLKEQVDKAVAAEEAAKKAEREAAKEAKKAEREAAKAAAKAEADAAAKKFEEAMENYKNLEKKKAYYLFKLLETHNDKGFIVGIKFTNNLKSNKPIVIEVNKISEVIYKFLNKSEATDATSPAETGGRRRRKTRRKKRKSKRKKRKSKRKTKRGNKKKSPKKKRTKKRRRR